MIAPHWPVLGVLYAGLSYGFMFVVNRFVVEAGVPFFGYVFWQAAGAAVIVLSLCALRRRLPTFDRAHLKLYLVTSVFGITVPFSILAYIAPKIPIGVVVISFGLIPTMTYAISLALKIERLVWPRMCGILLGFVGVLLIVVPETSLPSRDMAGWVLLTLTTPAAFAIATIAAEQLRPARADSLGIAAGLLITAAFSLVPVMVITGGWWRFAAPLDRVDGAILLAILIIASNYVVFFAVIRARGAVFWTLAGYFDVLFGIGWGVLLYHERHSPWVWAAAGLILGSLVLVNRTGWKAREAKAT